MKKIKLSFGSSQLVRVRCGALGVDEIVNTEFELQYNLPIGHFDFEISPLDEATPLPSLTCLIADGEDVTHYAKRGTTTADNTLIIPVQMPRFYYKRSMSTYHSDE